MKEKHDNHLGLLNMKLHDSYKGRKVVHTARVAAVLLVLLLLIGLGWNLFARWLSADSLEDRAIANSVIHVRTIHPSTDPANARLTLPGTLQANLEAQIYARTNGYVKKWFKDIGESVKKGEVLAILDIPEVERQVDEATANYLMTKTAYDRWLRLRAEDAVSQQELDEKTNSYCQAKAVLQRLRNQLSYGRIVAPFDGIVTKRNVNVGDLVNAGNGGVGQAMFALAQTKKMHVYVYVPQDQAAFIKIRDNVDIVRSDKPDQPIKGVIARTAGAIDLNSRTMQIDIEMPNPHRTLLPGTYVEVALSLKSAKALVLPTNALLFGSAGSQVAVVKEDKVQLRTITLGTDYGKVVVIKSGVSAADQVIINPPDSIISGQSVAVEEEQKKASPTADSSK